mmetsp:Transcript_1759/g.6217  ORF Transcript_1759/g.6217 Transcript_1759/m.6217 type:complete len:285 (-) Transcript_1759:1970-2824(-)
MSHPQSQGVFSSLSWNQTLHLPAVAVAPERGVSLPQLVVSEVVEVVPESVEHFEKLHLIVVAAAVEAQVVEEVNAAVVVLAAEALVVVPTAVVAASVVDAVDPVGDGKGPCAAGADDGHALKEVLEVVQILLRMVVVHLTSTRPVEVVCIVVAVLHAVVGTEVEEDDDVPAAVKDALHHNVDAQHLDGADQHAVMDVLRVAAPTTFDVVEEGVLRVPAVVNVHVADAANAHVVMMAHHLRHCDTAATGPNSQPAQMHSSHRPSDDTVHTTYPNSATPEGCSYSI